MLRRKLGLLMAKGEEVAMVSKNAELGFLAPFVVPKRMGFWGRGDETF